MIKSVQKWIGRLITAALVAIVVLLTITTAPFLTGQTLHGSWLLAHMGASGALVFLLPLYAVTGLIRLAARTKSSRSQSLGFWSLIATGLLTTSTVFACMLPIASTDQMHTLILSHAWAGYAMTTAAVVLVGSLLRRKKAAT